MKRAYTLFASCVVLVLSFVFTGSTFLGAVQKKDEAFGWSLTGAKWSEDRFSYTKRVASEDVAIGSSFPALYLDNLTQASSCGPANGANLIHYYDATYENLIPNASPFSSGTTYTKGSTRAEAAADQLYELMKTNKNQSGTLLTDYKNGLQTYVKNQGYKISYSSVMSGGKFSLSSYLSAINQKKPVSIVVKDAQYTENVCFSATANETRKSVRNTSISHILLAYGYVEYEYYCVAEWYQWSPVWYNPLRFVKVVDNIVFRTDIYLKVSFGDGTIGYLVLNKTTITDAFTSHITQ